MLDPALFSLITEALEYLRLGHYLQWNEHTVIPATLLIDARRQSYFGQELSCELSESGRTWCRIGQLICVLKKAVVVDNQGWLWIRADSKFVFFQWPEIIRIAVGRAPTLLMRLRKNTAMLSHICGSPGQSIIKHGPRLCGMKKVGSTFPAMIFSPLGASY